MPAVQFYRSFCRHLFTHLICSILSTHWLTCFSGKWETRIVVLVLFFFFRIFKEKAIFLTLYTHLYPRSDWQGIYSLYFFKLVLLNFIFIHGNLSNRYPTDSSWSEYRNEETVRIRIESTEWEKLESWPVLAAPGTSELRILVLYCSQTFEVSLAQGCLQLTSSVGHFSSCSHGPTIISISFSFYCNIIFSLSFTCSFFVCCPFLTSDVKSIW